LTTTIAEINVFLTNHPVPRDNVPKDFDVFKLFIERLDKTLQAASTSLKKLPKQRQPDQGSYDALACRTDDPALSDKSTADRIVTDDLRWEVNRFHTVWNRIQTVMTTKPDEFGLNVRVCNYSDKRMLVMSGLSWSHKSHSRSRDWLGVTTVVALETGYVESYREDLIEACQGAHALRNQLAHYFVSLSPPYHQTHPTTGNPNEMFVWEFPDRISLSTGENRTTSFNAEGLDARLSQAKDAAEKKAKIKQGVVQKFVESLFRNRLLWSSEEDVALGSVETSAVHHINQLARVRIHFHPLTLLVAHRTRTSFTDRHF
jgi:hypothetical protein